MNWHTAWSAFHLLMRVSNSNKVFKMIIRQAQKFFTGLEKALEVMLNRTRIFFYLCLFRRHEIRRILMTSQLSRFGFFLLLVAEKKTLNMGCDIIKVLYFTHMFNVHPKFHIYLVRSFFDESQPFFMALKRIVELDHAESITKIICAEQCHYFLLFLFMALISFLLLCICAHQ